MIKNNFQKRKLGKIELKKVIFILFINGVDKDELRDVEKK